MFGASRLEVHVAVGAAAGVLGSLPFWLEIDEGHQWYAAPHGVVWGCLVALGAWSAVRRERPLTPRT